nr:hypothetical protein [Tanacetum cinerariifolium]
RGGRPMRLKESASWVFDNSTWECWVEGVEGFWYGAELVLVTYLCRIDIFGPLTFDFGIFLNLSLIFGQERLINMKSKKVGKDANFIVQFEFYRINRVVSILPLLGLFSCERDGGGFHYFSKLYGLFMAKAKEILIALSLTTKAGCYHDLLPDDYNERFLSY